MLQFHESLKSLKVGNVVEITDFEGIATRATRNRGLSIRTAPCCIPEHGSGRDDDRMIAMADWKA